MSPFARILDLLILYTIPSMFAPCKKFRKCGLCATISVHQHVRLKRIETVKLSRGRKARSPKYHQTRMSHPPGRIPPRADLPLPIKKKIWLELSVQSMTNENAFQYLPGGGGCLPVSTFKAR